MEPNSDKNSSRREWRRYSFLCFFFPFSPRVSDDPRRFSRVSTLGGGLGPLVTRLANVHKRRATRVLCDAVSTLQYHFDLIYLNSIWCCRSTPTTINIWLKLNLIYRYILFAPFPSGVLTKPGLTWCCMSTRWPHEHILSKPLNQRRSSSGATTVTHNTTTTPSCHLIAPFPSWSWLLW